MEGQDPEEHLSGRSASSKTRNELIAQTLFKSGDIESQGTGIKRIKDFCDDAGIAVEYIRVPEGTKLVFHRNDAFGQSLLLDKVSNDTLNETISDTLNLSERDASVLAAIRESPKATAVELSEKLGVSESTVKRSLKELQTVGALSREGSRKTGRWVITEK